MINISTFDFFCRGFLRFYMEFLEFRKIRSWLISIVKTDLVLYTALNTSEQINNKHFHLKMSNRITNVQAKSKSLFLQLTKTLKTVFIPKTVFRSCFNYVKTKSKNNSCLKATFIQICKSVENGYPPALNYTLI